MYIYHIAAHTVLIMMLSYYSMPQQYSENVYNITYRIQTYLRCFICYEKAMHEVNKKVKQNLTQKSNYHIKHSKHTIHE